MRLLTHAGKAQPSPRGGKCVASHRGVTAVQVWGITSRNLGARQRDRRHDECQDAVLLADNGRSQWQGASATKMCSCRS